MEERRTINSASNRINQIRQRKNSREKEYEDTQSNDQNYIRCTSGHFINRMKWALLKRSVTECCSLTAALLPKKERRKKSSTIRRTNVQRNSCHRSFRKEEK